MGWCDTCEIALEGCVPGAAEQDRSERQNSLCAFETPTHPREFQTLSIDRLARRLGDAAADRNVVALVLAVTKMLRAALNVSVRFPKVLVTALTEFASVVQARCRERWGIRSGSQFGGPANDVERSQISGKRNGTEPTQVQSPIQTIRETIGQGLGPTNTRCETGYSARRASVLVARGRNALTHEQLLRHA